MQKGQQQADGQCQSKKAITIFSCQVAQIDDGRPQAYLGHQLKKHVEDHDGCNRAEGFRREYPGHYHHR
jgi:hypothetical protein